MKAIRFCLIAGGISAAAWFALDSATADISGSAHDFSTEGWSQNEICKPCHTPHNATVNPVAPLWNHELSSATYVLYDSQWLHEQIEQPGEGSRICLSCHDGTVALDSFGGATGTAFITGDANIGTDLSDDHPIGIPWSHQYPNLVCSNCHNPYDPEWEMPLPFFDSKVECLTCHDPHNGTIPAEDGMLRMSQLGSEICFQCHSL
jgi:predicted CXXCH cytochrome family protein